MAYIPADVPLVNIARDLDQLQKLCPQLTTSKTLLAGHFSTIKVADQVNAMIELAVGLSKLYRISGPSPGTQDVTLSVGALTPSQARCGVRYAQYAF